MVGSGGGTREWLVCFKVSGERRGMNKWLLPLLATSDVIISIFLQS